MPKKRCNYCNKKLGIVVYGCKCEFKSLCVKCKYPENHKCSFDFVAEGKKKLAEKNPIIKFDKLIKIN